MVRINPFPLVWLCFERAVDSAASLPFPLRFDLCVMSSRYTEGGHSYHTGDSPDARMTVRLAAAGAVRHEKRFSSPPEVNVFVFLLQGRCCSCCTSRRLPADRPGSSAAQNPPPFFCFLFFPCHSPPRLPPQREGSCSVERLGPLPPPISTSSTLSSEW